MTDNHYQDESLRIKIVTALGDPDSPWYGSDLVPLVADLLVEYDELESDNERLRKALDQFGYWVCANCDKIQRYDPTATRRSQGLPDLGCGEGCTLHNLVPLCGD